MPVFILIAVRNLYKNKTRTLILGGAIAGVALVLTILLALIQGIKSTMIANGTALMTGHVNVAGFYKISPSSASPLITDYSKLLEIAKQSVPEADFIIDRMKAYGKVISDSDSIQVPMWGVDINQEQKVIARLELAPIKDYWETKEIKNNGNLIEGNMQELSKTGTLAIFSSQAKKLKVHVGDQVTISMPTYRNTSNTKDVKVVAVLRDLGLMSQFSLFLNSKDAKEIYQLKESTTGQLMIFLKDIDKVSEVEDRLRKVYADHGYKIMEKESNPFFMKLDRVAGESWTGQKIDITTWEDETSFLKWILQLLTALTFALVFILLIIVVIGLMNSLWMTIRERTSEIGTLRAIGLQRRQVFILFSLETFLLCFCGTSVGALTGMFLAKLLDFLKIPINIEALRIFLMSNTLTFKVGFIELIEVFILMLSFLLIGALIPIWQATRLKPVTAMQNAS